MASPSKRRKLNNNIKSSNSQSRNLDYFFGKQNQRPTDSEQNENPSDSTELTDEQLARKLQAEWNNENVSESLRQPSSENSQRLEATQLSNQPEKQQILPNEVEERVSDIKLSDQAKSDDNQESWREPELGDSLSQEAQKTTLSLQSTGSAQDSFSFSIPFDESPLTFDPSMYLLDLQKQWAAEGGHAPYALLASCFVIVNSTQSRIKIVDALVNLLRVLIEGDPGSLLPAVWLATNAISPPYISLELGLGGSALTKALKHACGLDNRSLSALYKKHGDAGDVAFQAKKRQTFTLRKPKPLSIKGVHQSLIKIATTKGTGSGDIKQSIINKLIQDSGTPEESRYIVRTLCQHVCTPGLIQGKDVLTIYSYVSVP